MLRAVLLAAVLTVSSAAQAAPEDRGPYTVQTWNAGTLSLAQIAIPTLVYYPSDAPGPGPLLVLMHGFLRNGSYHVEMASTLASRGMVVVVPDLPCNLAGCNHDENAAQISALLEWGDAQIANAASPIAGLGNGQRGLIGHSFGGLGVFLATARDPGVDAVVLLDPRDDLNAAANEVSSIAVPSAHIMAQVRGACNDDWATAVFPGTPAPHLTLRVVGSGHCDVEDPSDSLCPIGCGSGDPSTSPMFRRYAVAFFRCVFFGDSESADYIGGSAFLADQNAGLIDTTDQAGLDQLSCRLMMPPPVDAGAPSDAGMAPDASAPDAAAVDAGSSTMDSGGSFSPDSGPDSNDVGTAVDAQSAADAAPSSSGQDASGPEPSESSGSCTCDSTTRAHAQHDHIAMMTLALMILRRRSARRTKRPAA